MSYLRVPLYVWDDGQAIHLWVRKGHECCVPFDPEDNDSFSSGIAIKQEIFDALALYRVAQLEREPSELKRAIKMAEDLAGNVGSYAFKECFGKHPRGKLVSFLKAAASRPASEISLEQNPPNVAEGEEN